MARLSTTPTTAAVMAESAPFNALLPRNTSMKGAPRNIQRKQGVNVTQVLRPATQTAPNRHDNSGKTCHPTNDAIEKSDAGIGGSTAGGNRLQRRSSQPIYAVDNKENANTL